MRKAFSTHIVSFILFAFCGQVLASPFLNCCTDMIEEQNEELVMDHQSDALVGHNHDIEKNVTDSSHNHNSMVANTDVTECDHMCDFCLGSASSISSEPEVLAKVEASSLKDSSYTFFSTSSHLDTPFRPPIIA